MTERGKIYTVTTLGRGAEGPRRERTWGWYSTAEEAKAAALNNVGNIFEMGYYAFALVEEVQEGIIPTCRTRWWFQATYREGSNDPLVTPLVEPDWARHALNFAMG